MQEKKELLTDEVKKVAGMELKTRKSLPVQASDILRYCEATGNINPVYTNAEYAGKTKYGGLVAPPTFFVPAFSLVPGAFKPVPRGTNVEDVAELAEKLPFKHALHAATKTTFIRPICPGDVLTRKGKIVNVKEKQTRVRPGVLCEVMYTTNNQNGEEVLSETVEIFYY